MTPLRRRNGEGAEEQVSQNSRPCANCNGEMLYMKREHLQLGKTGWIFGDWSNLLAGALEVDIWACPRCGKLEFYLARPEELEPEEDRMFQITCPNCGYEHDLDDPKCPRCGSKNMQMEGDRMLRITCPNCGCEHDLDDPKCPHCGSKNTQM